MASCAKTSTRLLAVVLLLGARGASARAQEPGTPGVEIEAELDPTDSARMIVAAVADTAGGGLSALDGPGAGGLRT